VRSARISASASQYSGHTLLSLATFIIRINSAARSSCLSVSGFASFSAMPGTLRPAKIRGQGFRSVTRRADVRSRPES
jgi:hypothetical protein